MFGWIGRSSVAVAVYVCTAGAVAQVTIETVIVDNPGNVADNEIMVDGTTGYGRVDYAYRIGKYEITNGHYVEFLNSVAQSDTYSLYAQGIHPCPPGIERTGEPGSYHYRLKDGDTSWLNRPVSCVSFWTACRFANWLHNGQPTGSQGPATTEDGSYTLDGYTEDEGTGITRNPGATWVIPTENEWYKAAYYDANAGLYYDYPTGTNETPSNDLLNPDPGNNANFAAADPTMGDPYWTTEVGEFENSASPYGTFDQGGNLWEWLESLVPDHDIPGRGVRGGDFTGGTGGYGAETLHARHREHGKPPFLYDLDDGCLGFRLVLLPEPAGPPEDLDRDGDVDLQDYALFQRALTGPL